MPIYTRQGHIFAMLSCLLLINIALSGVVDTLPRTLDNKGMLLMIQEIISSIALIIELLFWFYQCESLPKNAAQKNYTIVIIGIVTFYAVLIILNLFYPILYDFDNNAQLTYPGFLIEFILAAGIYAIYLAYIIFQHCTLKKKISLASRAFFPLFYGVIDLIWYKSGSDYDVTIVLYIFMLMAAYVVYFGDYIESRELLLSQKAELALKEQRQTELQTALMLSQIRPHFLFNALTSIRSLCKNDPARAYTALGQFADYIRGNMEALDQGRIITFEKELEHIQAYLMLEQMRFGDDLKVEYDILFQDFSIPALTLQPIVENAVRHGATMNENGGIVSISTRETLEGALITVTDNGPGFDPDATITDGKTHFGLNNVRGSLNASGYGELQIQSYPGEGTTVTIVIWGNKE